MNILTEEELKERNRLLVLENENLNGHIEGLMQRLEDREPYYAQQFYKTNDRNKSLVLENDELNAENEMHVRYERYLVLLIDAGGKYVEEHDFEWFKQIWNDDVNRELEETK